VKVIAVPIQMAFIVQ